MVNSNYFFLILLVCLCLVSGGGADYYEYLRWADYFNTFDVRVFDKLNIHGLGLHKSKNGLPMSSWSYGPGIFTAFINKIFFFLNKDISIKISNIFLASINLFLLSKILEQKKIYNLNKLFLICLFILFFPGGFYINKGTSESWTVLLSLISIYFIEDKEKKFYINFLIIGFCFYFLLLIKLPNIFICFFLFINLIVNNLKNWKKNKIFSKKLVYIYFLVFFFILPIGLILTYQNIVFGDYFTNAYSFGDENIKSFDIKNFKIKEVLFSTWHGLFFYHPLYIILNYSLFYFFLKKKLDFKIYILLLIYFFLIFSQILIQASWSFWWMGTGTYGSRGFSGVSVITFYLLLLTINNYKTIKNNYTIIFFLIALTIWNVFLFYLGETNFINLNSFINKVTRSASVIFLIKICFIILFFFFLRVLNKLNNLNFLKLTLISLTFFIFISDIYSNFKIYGVINIIFFSVLIYFLYNSSILFFLRKKIVKINLQNFFNLLFIIIFLTSLFFQYQLFSNFYNLKNINYKNGVNFNCIELRQTLDEYKYIKEYKTDKYHWEIFYQKNCSNILF